jgi:hypothetical protein
MTYVQFDEKGRTLELVQCPDDILCMQEIVMNTPLLYKRHFG